MDVMEAARKRDFSSQRVALALSPLPPLASSKFQVLMMAFSLLFFCTRFFPGCKSIITSGLLLLISTSSLFCPSFSQAIFQMRFICFKSQGN